MHKCVAVQVWHRNECWQRGLLVLFLLHAFLLSPTARNEQVALYIQYGRAVPAVLPSLLFTSFLNNKNPPLLLPLPLPSFTRNLRDPETLRRPAPKTLWHCAYSDLVTREISVWVNLGVKITETGSDSSICCSNKHGKLEILAAFFLSSLFLCCKLAFLFSSWGKVSPLNPVALLLSLPSCDTQYRYFSFAFSIFIF